MALPGPDVTKGDERNSRILSAALEVFSKSSFDAATTEEIARRAHVSKRDLYAAFPDKHAILIKVIETVLDNGEASLRRAIADSQKTAPTIQMSLEIMELALVSEMLSPLEGFVSRLAFAESAKHPLIGKNFLEGWYSRRNQIVAQALSNRLQKANNKTGPRKAQNASQHFLALITHFPQLTVALGITEMWTPKSVQAHVKNSVECFLNGYPSLE